MQKSGGRSSGPPPCGVSVRPPQSRVTRGGECEQASAWMRRFSHEWLTPLSLLFSSSENTCSHRTTIFLLLCLFLSRFARSRHSPVMAQRRLIPCGGLADGPPSRDATPESCATRWRSLRTPRHHKARATRTSSHRSKQLHVCKIKCPG